MAYSKKGALTPVELSFKDEQTVEDKGKFLSGILPMQLTSQEKPFDAVPWLAEHTVKEMTARGLPVTSGAGTPNNTGIVIKRVHIENYRASGFSPFVTFTSLRADVMTPLGPKRVTAYIKRGKVPVWSFDEIIDPTYNAPLALLTKELAAKLNQQLFRQVVGNDEVNALIAKIDANSLRDDAYLDVYQLGFSNNPAAVPALVKFTSNSDEYVRLAAISSLGVLKATDQMNFLIGLYEKEGGLWQDRAMALKAIGDMDTAESRAYLQKRLESFADRKDKDALWTKEIIALYM